MNKNRKKISLAIAIIFGLGIGAYAMLGSNPSDATVTPGSPSSGSSNNDNDPSSGEATQNNDSVNTSVQQSSKIRKKTSRAASLISSSSSTLDESKMPIGRYRNQVFSTVQSSKDITYSTKFAVELIEESETNYILGEDTNQTVDLKLNVYRPTNDPISKRPLIIFVYGGGWVFGDRYQQEASAEHFARMGYTTMTIDYTMFPDDAPAPIPSEDYSVYTGILKKSGDDLYSAYQFGINHAEEYGIDKSRIAFAGWPAGGMISASVANMAAFPTPTGLRAVLGSSSSIPAFLSGMHELTGGFKSYGSTYSPTNMLASYDDDTGYGGAPNDHAADCAYLDSIGNRCITVTYEGSGHEQEFYQEPLASTSMSFFAQYLAGY